MNKKQIRHIREIQPFFWLLIVLLLFALLSSLEHSNPDHAPRVLESGWSVNGSAVDSLPERDIRGADEKTVLSRVLDDDFSSPQAICFYSVYQDVTVKLNDVVIYTFTRPAAESLIEAAPSYWNVVSLPGNDSGKTLTIDLVCPYSEYANHINSIRFGTTRDINSYVTRMTLPKLLLAVGILFIAMVFSIVAVYMRYHISGNTGMYSLSLSLTVLAIFLISSQASILLSLYSGTSYVAIQCCAFMLCPVMFLRYLARVHTGFRQKASRMLFIIGLVNIAIVSLMQLLHIADMPQLLFPTRVLCFITVFYIFILELFSHRRALIIIFAFAMAYGMWHYYRTGTITWLMYPGIFAYTFILVYRLINTVVRGQLEEVRLKTELEVSKSELATVQITSHFFYHTLDSIRALIKIDSDKAYKMTGDFAKYLRYRVDGVERMEEKVLFSRELRSIRAYTDIKQAQLGDRFKMEFDIAAEDFEILPLTVQPLVENAVIHAIQHRRDGGFIRLVCREMKNSYHISVIDNGPGGSYDQTPSKDRNASTAIHNVNTRLAWYGIPAVKLESNEFGGMTASLETPKILERKDR